MVIGIRSAPSGRYPARLSAGAGIVAGSVPGGRAGRDDGEARPGSRGPGPGLGVLLDDGTVTPRASGRAGPGCTPTGTPDGPAGTLGRLPWARLAAGAVGPGGPGRHPPAATASPSGMRTTNVVPGPPPGATSAVPPSASAMARTMDSPSRSPGRCGPRRPGRSGRRPGPPGLGSMPGPSSRTGSTPISPGAATSPGTGCPAGCGSGRCGPGCGPPGPAGRGPPTTVTGPVARDRCCRAGSTAHASSTASAPPGAGRPAAALEGAALVEPGQQEQVVDEAAHARRLVLDAARRPVPALLVGEDPLAQRARRSRGSR